MSDFSDQIGQIEKEIRETPYHKGTEHHIGRLRARLVRLKERQIEGLVKAKGGGGGGGYSIKKQGDSTVVLIGPPSSGKSTLLNKLTNAESKVAPYAFTTVSVIPGMFIHQGAYIQILDVPGLIEGARKGKGRGKEVLSVARGADLLVIMTDVKRPGFIKTLVDELEDAGIRINKKRPNVKIDKKLQGGLAVYTNIKQDFSEDTVKEVSSEFGIKNADITIKEKISLDQLIDSFAKNRVYIPAIYAVNKIDEGGVAIKDSILENSIPFSAQEEINLDKLIQKIWEKLELVRVYLVEEGKEKDLDSPMIMKKGDTIQAIVDKLGTDIKERYTMAKIWGDTARYPGQEVPFKTPLKEGMEIRFI